MAKDHNHNEGIIQSGGVINAGQLAVGHRARITQVINAADAVLTQKGLDEVRSKLDELFRTLSAHGTSLEQRNQVWGSLEQVAGELAKERPNKLTLTSLLDGIAHAVKSVTTIASAAGALKAAVAAFL